MERSTLEPARFGPRPLLSPSWRNLWLALRTGAARLRPRRVPVIRQLTATECGAACLAMILTFHGRATRLAECRGACGAGRDGVTARRIVEAARSFGLRARAFSIEPTQLGHVPLPAIAHWNFSHFVVVERWSSGAVGIVDPATGRRRVSAADVDAAFTGVVLTFEPSQTLEQRTSAARPMWLQYLLRHLVARPAVVGQILAASLVLQALGLVLPLLTAVFVDYVLPVQDGDLLALLGLGICVFSLTHLLTGYLRAALIAYLQSHLDVELMLGFVGHLLTLPLSFFALRPSGDILQRLSSNMIIRELLTGHTVSLVLDGGLILVYLLVLLAREP
jgi:ABC-type bacteriocin/lantibiotic exporter with double-glycine peptidase domain